MSSSRALVALREIDPVELPIFADLLTRISRFRPLGNHAYGAMSGFALDDQKRLYRTLGARPMLSIDDRMELVARQRFNRPTMKSRVSIVTFERFATEWPQVFAEEGIEDAENFILWVRRDTSEEVGQTVRYFQQMVSGLPESGIARITLKVHFETWAGPLFEEGRRLLASERKKVVGRKVAEFLGEFLEEKELASEIDEDGLCALLATAFGSAAATAVGGPTGRTFEPLSVILYGADVLELTLTGMVVSNGEREELRRHVEDGQWPFASRDWDDIKKLRFPDLTFRERIELEASAGDKVVASNRLHFDLDEATCEPGVFDSFARYHRYLPMEVAAEF